VRPLRIEPCSHLLYPFEHLFVLQVVRKQRPKQKLPDLQALASKHGKCFSRCFHHLSLALRVIPDQLHRFADFIEAQLDGLPLKAAENELLHLVVHSGVVFYYFHNRAIHRLLNRLLAGDAHSPIIDTLVTVGSVADPAFRHHGFVAEVLSAGRARKTLFA
jgi:hypothetical protein